MQEGWTEEGPADKNAILKLTIALRQSNMEKLEKMFWERSDPKHADYSKWLSVEELTAIIAPPTSAIAKVSSWLVAGGAKIEGMPVTKDYIFASAPVSVWSRLLFTEFSSYFHAEQNARLIKANGAYSLPQNIAALVNLVVGVKGLPKLNKPNVFTANVQDPVAKIGPSDLRARYNVTVVGKNATNLQAVAEFQAQYFVPSDLGTRLLMVVCLNCHSPSTVKFFQKFVPGNTNDVIEKVIGVNVPSNPGTEAELDVQYIMGVAPNVPTWVFSVKQFDFWTDLTNWLATIQNMTQVPYVISVSYGDQAESQPSTSYKLGLSAEFMKLGLRGVSVLFASGDSGTGCDNCRTFQASFPSTSPYLTAVGATQFQSGTSGPEEATTRFPSGGGFSHTFAPASYQAPFIKHYLTNTQGLPAPDTYNASGRGTPDVSALGDGFQVFQSGTIQVVGGTSASTPTFSAIVSLLNEARWAAGKPSLGFLNPWLYQIATSNPTAFFDVTKGNNQYGCCKTGFPCAPGWDPVTGLGTPNFEVLRTLV